MNTMDSGSAVLSVPGSVGGGARGSSSRRGFIAAVLLLLLAATGMRFSVYYLKLVIHKKPVPMQQAFDAAMPRVIGSWVRIADRTQSPEILGELAAQDWLFCSYVNAAALKRTAAELSREISKLNYEEQEKRLATYQRENPAAVLALGLTYYTGKVDAVDHIAERCYHGSGFATVEGPSTKTWPIGDRQLDVRFITFEHQASRPPVRRDVAYFFQVNGRYEGNHWAVRAALQNLFVKYGYYAKVELASTGLDPDASAKAMQEFLSVSLPQIERALPDWSQYKDRK